MIQKIICSNSLRFLNGLSRSLFRLDNPLKLKSCYSTQVTNSYSNQNKCLNLQRILANHQTSQVAKLINNNLIQTRPMSSADHVKLWKIERIVSAAFLPLVPACFLLDNAVLDALLAVLTVTHVHWGLEAIIIDYARPSVVGPIVPKLSFVALYVTSILTLAGLLVLVYNGPGISKVIKQGWAIGKENNQTNVEN